VRNVANSGPLDSPYQRMGFPAQKSQKGLDVLDRLD
jgi:hypothetical protein